mgnify:CR=1 FL=1
MCFICELLYMDMHLNVFLSQIIICVFLSLLTLQVLFFNQDINTFLDNWHLGLEPWS